MPPTPGIHNLNEAFLFETKKMLVGRVSDAAIQFGIAQQIIINTLGLDFWKKECTTFGSKQSFMSQNSDAVIMQLAHMLWSLRNSTGFADFLRRADLKKIESAYYELYAANLFKNAGSTIEFNKPQSQKGSDFDLIVTDIAGFGVLNVEVKARSQVFPDQTAVINKLNKARGQLPGQSNGAIIIKLKNSERSITRSDFEAAVVRFLNNTDRVKFVTYIWDQSQDANVTITSHRTLSKDGPTGEISSVRVSSGISFINDLTKYEQQLASDG